MALLPASAAVLPKQESIVKAVPVAVAVLSALGLCASFARAQATTDATAQQSAAPLQLQLPAQPVQEVPAASDNAIVDAQDSHPDEDDAKRGPQVHGSFTTGIGYSKGYGTSTMNAADLSISGQTDSGRTYDMQIHLMQSKGPGFDPYGGYFFGPRYR